MTDARNVGDSFTKVVTVLRNQPVGAGQPDYNKCQFGAYQGSEPSTAGG
jgi:hypothetical protein